MYRWFQPICAQKWTHHRQRASLSISQARKAIKEEEHQPSFWPFFRTHFLAWIRCQLLYSSTTYIPCYSTMYDYIKSCISRLKSSHLLIVYKCKLTFTGLLIKQGFLVVGYLLAFCIYRVLWSSHQHVYVDAKSCILRKLRK